jgi:hypothetical protein
MSGEEEHLSREEFVEREHQARLREREEWPKRLEEICREAEIRWWAAHPWLSSAGAAWLARMVYDGAGSKAGSLRAAFELIAAPCIRLSYGLERALVLESNQRCFLYRVRVCLAAGSPFARRF